MSLPGILADLAEVAGVRVALELARRHGGTEISLSTAKGSALVKAIGLEAATALVERRGRGKVMVPMATARGQKGRRAAAAEMQLKGASALDAARACDIHHRTAWRARAAAKKRGGLPLFPEGDDSEG